MEDKIKSGYLYDFYGELLTEHQKKIYEDVVYNNLSLNEIAEDEGISKQGVHDLVKRCDKTLSEYEDKLKLIERGKKAGLLLDELDKMNLPGEALSKLKDIRELI